MAYHLPGMRVQVYTAKVADDQLTAELTIFAEFTSQLELPGGAKELPLRYALPVNVKDAAVTGQFEQQGGDKPRKGAVTGSLAPHAALGEEATIWVRAGGSYGTTHWLVFKQKGGVLTGDHVAVNKTHLAGTVEPIRAVLENGRFEAELKYLLARQPKATQAKLEGVVVGDLLFGYWRFTDSDGRESFGRFRGGMARFDAQRVMGWDEAALRRTLPPKKAP